MDERTQTRIAFVAAEHSIENCSTRNGREEAGDNGHSKQPSPSHGSTSAKLHVGDLAMSLDRNFDVQLLALRQLINLVRLIRPHWLAELPVLGTGVRNHDRGPVTSGR